MPNVAASKQKPIHSQLNGFVLNLSYFIIHAGVTDAFMQQQRHGTANCVKGVAVGDGGGWVLRKVFTHTGPARAASRVTRARAQYSFCQSIITFALEVRAPALERAVESRAHARARTRHTLDAEEVFTAHNQVHASHVRNSVNMSEIWLYTIQRDEREIHARIRESTAP